jgi:TolA-binding protein
MARSGIAVMRTLHRSVVAASFVAIFSTLVSTGVAQAPKNGDKKPAPAAKTDDRVTRVGKPVVKGTVVSETCAEVVVRKDNGLEERIPFLEVVSVDRASAPEAYRRGAAAAASGDHANAIQLLQAALTKHPDLGWLKEAANFYLGESFRATGRLDDAAKAYDAVVAAKADSRWLAAARTGAAKALISGGKYAEADRVLSAFVSEADSKKVPKRLVLAARELSGSNLEAQKKYVEAAAAFETVAREAKALVKDDPAAIDRYMSAMRAKASCLIKEGKFDDAGKALEALSNEKTSEATALVLSGQGESALAQGKLDDARFLLSRVMGARFEADNELPRVKWLLAKTLTELAKAGEKGAAEAARFYLNDLIQRDAATEFAKEARALAQGSR